MTDFLMEIRMETERKGAPLSESSNTENGSTARSGSGTGCGAGLGTTRGRETSSVAQSAGPLRRSAVVAARKIAACTHNQEDIALLISHFRSGQDLDLLKQMIRSSDTSLATDGAYILSEIGVSGESLYKELRYLLATNDYQLRYWLIISFTSHLNPAEFTRLIEEYRLADDDFDLIRERVEKHLSRCSR